MMGRCIGLKANKIKTLNEENLLFIEKVFAKHSDLHCALIASANSPRNCGLFEFSSENHHPLIASIHESEWHPHCVYTRLAYDLDEPDLQLLQFCIEFLRDEFDKPLFFLLDDRFNALASILVELGFPMIRKTEVVHIQPATHHSSDAPLTTVAQISENVDCMNSLVELSKCTYTETHVSNPVGNHPFQSWREVVLDGLLLDYSYVVLEGKKVLAFSLLYEGEGNNWELGWVGAENDSNLYLLDAILARQLADAKENKIAFIEKEVDSTCPYSLHICKSVPYEVVETLFAYVN